MMTRRVMAVIGGALAGLALLALTIGPTAAQAQPPVGGAPTHEQMHRMMDAMHGEGTSERMHEAMGEDGEKLMDQCVSMMGMMQNMQGMMNGNMSGMMGGQNDQSMQDMMRNMMRPAPEQGR